MKNITIIGGGGSSLVMAAILSEYNVTVLTRNPDKWNRYISVECMNETIYSSEINITDCYETAIKHADMIFYCGIPPDAHRDSLKRMKPYITKGQFIGCICSYGGFDLICKEVLADSYVSKNIFGFQSIPWVCTCLEYGKLGKIHEKKLYLHMFYENNVIFDFFKKILNVPIYRIDQLTCILWPNNPVIHPPIFYGIFSNLTTDSHLPTYLYSEMTDTVAECLENISVENLMIANRIKELYPDNNYLKMVRGTDECVLDHYKHCVSDASSLKGIFCTNKAYADSKVPYDQNGRDPDINSRYFRTDIPYGLCILKALALKFSIDTPQMDRIIYWAQKIMGVSYLVDGKLTGADKDVIPDINMFEM